MYARDRDFTGKSTAGFSLGQCGDQRKRKAIHLRVEATGPRSVARCAKHLRERGLDLQRRSCDMHLADTEIDIAGGVLEIVGCHPAELERGSLGRSTRSAQVRTTDLGDEERLRDGPLRI